MEHYTRPSWGRTIFYYGLVILLGCLIVLLLAQIRRAKAVPDETYKSLDVFIEVLQNVRRNYVTEVEPEQLIEGAIQGLFNACTVDEDTAYLTRNVYDSLFTNPAPGDVGILLHLTGCRPTVAAVIPGSPAAAADIQVGDLLMEVKDEAKGLHFKDTSIRSRYELAAALRGTPGTEVKLTLYRSGWSDTKEITVQRAEVKMPVLGETKLLGDGLGYLPLLSIGPEAADKVSQALKDLAGKTETLKGLILDLRNTPAGNLEQAVKIADLFIEQGQIAKIQQTADQTGQTLSASKSSPYEGLPLAVLINNSTAQEAEVLAAALSYHRCGVLLGSTTHGNASLEKEFKDRTGGIMMISVSLYETPGGVTFQGKGIAPHEVIPQPPREEGGEPETDPVLERAVELLSNPDDYSKVLAKK